MPSFCNCFEVWCGQQSSGNKSTLTHGMDLRKTVWFFLCCTCCAGLVIPPVAIRRHLRPGLASNLWIWSPIQSLMMLWMYWVCPTNSSCFQEGNPADGVFLMGKPHAATPIEAKFKKSRSYDLYIQLSLSLSILIYILRKKHLNIRTFKYTNAYFRLLPGRVSLAHPAI